MNDHPEMELRNPAKNEDAMSSSRRNFLVRGAGAGAALTMLGGVAGAQTTRPAGGIMPAGEHGMSAELYPGAVDANGQYVLPPLPYDYGSLEPHIDEETMRLHHDKHHQGYVNGLKSAEEKLAQARRSGNFDDVEHLSQKAAFHGAGHFLHSIFWASMSPDGGGKPSGELARAIERDFGSHDACMNQFSKAAGGVEGSGWGLLTFNIPARKLNILQARNHQLATQWANIPLLVIDVWEHAYYKSYSNNRGEYVAAFQNVIDWQNVGRRYAAARAILG